MDRPTALTLRFAGLHGLCAVGFGAFGAHALPRLLAALPAGDAAARAGWMETGARYELAHAAALLALAALAPRLAPGRTLAAAWCFGLGAAAFSGSLYALALGAPRGAGLVTPVGGVALLAGWAWVAAAARG